MHQITIKVTSYVTFTTEHDRVEMKDIPVKTDAFDSTEDESSPIKEVVETDVINKEFVSMTEI